MKTAFGGVIAVVLLGLWVYLVVTGCETVLCASAAGCSAHPVAAFTDQMSQGLTLIGGLVSALVIAELAITRTGEMPAAHMLAAVRAPWAKLLLQVISGVYVLAWLAAGLAALLVGWHHPHVLPPLTSVGQAWLGLAVASAYAYFGLRPAQ